MISRYSEILHYSKLLNLELSQPGHIQKIYSTARFISLQLRVQGKTIFCVIGRGGGYEGLFIGENHPKSFLRKRDRWLEWMRKNLSGALLLAFEVDKIDRAIGIVIQKGGAREVVRIAWIGRLSYFSHESHDQLLFSSWGKLKESTFGFDVFDSVGRRSIETLQDVRDLNVNSMYELEEKEALNDKSVTKTLRKKKIKAEKIKHDLEKIGKWREVQRWLEGDVIAELEQKKKIEFGDLIIKFPAGSTAFQKRDQIFKKIKSLKEIEAKQRKRLEDEVTTDDRNKQNELPSNTLKIIGPVWKSEKIEVVKEIVELGYKVIRKDGYSIALGQNAQGNDRLRKEWARAEDIWVHLSNAKSAHAVIKLNQGVVFDHAMLRQAAKYISFQSGDRESIVEVIFTPIKNLKGVSGSAGMVIFKKEKRLTIDIRELENE